VTDATAGQRKKFLSVQRKKCNMCDFNASQYALK